MYDQCNINVVDSIPPSGDTKNGGSYITDLDPNPVEDELTIKSDVAPTQMKIYDVAGRQIITVPEGIAKIDVSSLSAGVYVLKMNLNGVEMQSEFVKK